jgi:hypothetical protein
LFYATKEAITLCDGKSIFNRGPIVLTERCAPNGFNRLPVKIGKFAARTRRRPAARFILVGLYSARREETIRRTQWLPTTTHPWMNLNAMIYQGRGSEEQATKKRRPPAKIANRLRPHPVRWRAIDARRSADLRAAGLMGAGKSVSSSTACMMASRWLERSVPLGRASSRMQALVRTWCGIRSGIPRLRGKCRQAPTCGKLLDGSA